MIGIIGALEEEVVLFKHDMDIKKIETVAGREFVIGFLNGREVVVTRSGMGKVNAASCASILIHRYNASFIINTGVGGCLDHSLNVLDVVIAKDVVQHDYDVVSLGYELGQVDNFDSPYFECDKDFVRAIKNSADKFNIPATFARFASGDRFIDKQEDKDWIVEHFHAQVCDMESGAVSQICALNKVPFANIRTISDSSSGEQAAIDFNKFLKIASTHSVIIIEDAILSIAE